MRFEGEQMADAERKDLPTAKPEPAIPIEKLPAGLRRLLRTLPERELARLRAFVIDCEEVGQLAETIPLASRAMELCPPRMITRIRAKEITGLQVDEVYNAFHDAIHAVRQAVYRIFQLAGLSPHRGPRTDAGPGGSPEGGIGSPPAVPGGEARGTAPKSARPAA